ncbi:MAG: hypothetical protein JXN59_04495, partial [Anaerolineae bacterium]|nr:hypothetical protein [Anaerolineae bacterium]
MTMETPAVQPKNKRRRQMRSFALVWTAITLVIGLATFAAIFFATGWLLPDGLDSAIVSAAEIITPTARPTTEATPIPQVQAVAQQPTSPPAAVAQQATETPTDTPEPTPAPTLSFIEQTDFDFGIQVQESYDIYEYWMTVVSDQLHLEWIKQQVRWEVMEETQGEIDWTILDIVIPEAHRAGVNVMLSIVTSPDWARQPGVNLSKHGPPADPQTYVNFVTAILDRYLEEYPGTIGAIEVWNEMNLDREWASVNGLSSREYITLLSATYNAIKAIDPGIIVISGALSPGGGWTEPDGRVSAIDDFAYFDALLNNGMLNYTDCVGAHHNGYNIGPLVPWDEAPRDPEAATARY